MTPAHGEIVPQSVEIAEQHGDLRPRVIVIENSKLTLILERHLASVIANRDWITPATLCGSTLLTLVTADFHETWGIAAATWQSGFGIAFLITGVWLVTAFVRRRRSCSVDQLVDKIKAGDTGGA